MRIAEPTVRAGCFRNSVAYRAYMLDERIIMLPGCSDEGPVMLVCHMKKRTLYDDEEEVISNVEKDDVVVVIGKQSTYRI